MNFPPHTQIERGFGKKATQKRKVIFARLANSGKGSLLGSGPESPRMIERLTLR